MTTTATDRFLAVSAGDTGAPALVRRASMALTRDVDAASVVLFRVIFGLLVTVSAARYAAKGWIAEHFVEPRFFFPYWGFEWVKPLPEGALGVLFVALGVAGLGVALGLFYRACIVLVLVLFTYVHLLDVTYYLNHYYLVTCLALLASVLPLARSGSLDARRKAGTAAATTVPAWVLWCLRAQIGIVYFYAGFQKLKPDWLFHAEPLKLWLAASSDVPLLGAFVDTPWIAPLMSWAGALFDLCVVPLLLWKRTRLFAYVALVGFHAVTARLFPLGMFPWIMSLVALVFFEPEWPRRFLSRLAFFRADDAPTTRPRETPRSPAWLVPVLALWFAFQLLMPLRHFLYPGDVSWTEQGFRYSWSVMLLEKSGSVDLYVKDRDSGRVHTVSPRDYLTPAQTRMMSTQPDMILSFAHHVGRDYQRRGIPNPEVRADVFVSWNGRPAERLVDPGVDLFRERESLAAKHWLLPAPRDPPP